VSGLLPETPRVDEGACAGCGAVVPQRLSRLCFECCRRRWRRMSDEQQERADEGDLEVWHEEPPEGRRLPSGEPAAEAVQEPLLTRPEEPS
jgi:hypothetical protein